MAIISLGDLVVGIRGSVGGVTYSAALTGPYCRGYSRSGNPRSPAQQYSRSRLSALGARWAALTSAQRTAWGALSAAPPEPVVNSLGQTITLSGWQWFCKVVLRRWLVTDPPSFVAPGTGAPFAPPAAVLAVSAAGTCQLDASPSWWSASSAYVYLFAGIGWGVGQATPVGGRRLVGVVAAPAGVLLDFGSGLRAVLPVLPVGGVCSVWYGMQSLDGLRSEFEVVRTAVITA